MDTEKKDLKPTITLDFQLLELLALEYVEKLPHFKDLELSARAELDYNDEMTGSIIVSVD